MLLAALLLAFAFSPTSAVAEPVNLLYVHEKDGDIRELKIDFDNAEVLLPFGQKGEDVIITEEKVRWMHNMGPAGKWPSTLSRLSGVLEVQIPNTHSSIGPWVCEKAIRRF